MDKYINADCLKAKLDEYYRKYQSKYMETRFPYVKGLVDALDLAEQVINSLQQEQCLIVIDKKDWEAQEQFRKNKDFGKPLQQEQQTSDLDADIEMEWDSFDKNLAKYGEESEEVVWLNWHNFNELARYFYELGLKARKEE